ncbi:helix-turn-helix domain-containing protein [Streptomyces sp. NPDC091281]|uniref:helix-turn-helix domain-containing protein n=1 Tax=Streptomyces sp. NPDC091281 TaxID=3365985 RepID=UPI0037FA6E90
MTRHCNIGGCTKAARPGRRICSTHRHRLARYGDPHFTQWTVADEADVELIIAEQRPSPGLTRLERIKVGQGLSQIGLPATEIARILGVTERTVYRWRSKPTPASPVRRTEEGAAA